MQEEIYIQLFTEGKIEKTKITKNAGTQYYKYWKK